MNSAHHDKISVHFYRKVLGLPFAVSQGTVEIRSARNEARAILAAKRKFERRLGVKDWRIRADSFDVASPASDDKAQGGGISPAVAPDQPAEREAESGLSAAEKARLEGLIVERAN